MRSEDVDDVDTTMQPLHELVKQYLQGRNDRYKQSTYLKRKYIQSKVEDLVLEHIKKERFTRGEYSKLEMKKIKPCRILRNFEQMHMNMSYQWVQEFPPYSMLQTYILTKEMIEIQQLQLTSRQRYENSSCLQFGHKKLTNCWTKQQPRRPKTKNILTTW